MSDTNAETPTSNAADVPATADPVSGALSDLQRDNADLAAKLKDAQSMLTGLTSERDTLKSTMSKLEVKAKEADQLRAKIEDFGRKEREVAIVEALRAKGVKRTTLEIQGVMMALHEAGKANRFAEDAAAESAKFHKLFETEAPGLLQSPTSGGGSQSARPLTGGSAFRGPLSRG